MSWKVEDIKFRVKKNMFLFPIRKRANKTKQPRNKNPLVLRLPFPIRLVL